MLKALRPPRPAFSVTSRNRPLAVVMEEAVLADGSDQEVGEAVVVIVADGDAHAVHFHREAGHFGDVGESAVAIVPVQPHGGALAAVAGPVHAIDQQDVEPAVAIVIEEGAPGAHGFGEVLGAERAAVVAELNTGGGGDVGQAEFRGGRGAERKRGGAREEGAPGHEMLTRPWRMA